MEQLNASGSLISAYHNKFYLLQTSKVCAVTIDTNQRNAYFVPTFNTDFICLR
jgi:hypothetical protein